MAIAHNLGKIMKHMKANNCILQFKGQTQIKHI